MQTTNWSDMYLEELNRAIKSSPMGQVIGGGLGSKQMTAYEKQTITSVKDIQYGSGATIDQLTMAYGYFGAVVKFIQDAGYEVPTELTTARDASKRDLDQKLNESRKNEIISIKAELNKLKSAEEKRTELLDKLAKLEISVN